MSTPPDQAVPVNRFKSFPLMNVIGIMSGTSMDSIDVACVELQLASSRPPQLGRFSVIDSITMDLSQDIRARLLKAMNEPAISLDNLCKLNMDMGHQFANAALLLIKKLKSKAIDVDLIASHGQTIYHKPPSPGHEGYTLQIGEPSIIAERTELEVVADFRPGDMAAGGHGAPLVPFADLLMFQDPERPIAIQNIGGIANVTALPPSNNLNEKPLAFDNGPGNMIIDSLMQILFQQPMDRNGDTARKGKVHTELLDHLMSQPYLSQPPPKSTGRELFGTNFAQQLANDWGRKMSKEDLIHTVTMFTVNSIAQSYEQFVLPKIRVREVIVGGGGTLNRFMLEKLEEALRPFFISLRIHEDFGIDSKYKEAIAFAILGYARKMGIPNNLPSCTGAHRPVSLGAIWYP